MPYPSFSNNDCWYKYLTPGFPTIFVGINTSLLVFQQSLLEIYRLSRYTNNLCWNFIGYHAIPTIFVGNLPVIDIYKQTLSENFG